MCVADVIRRFTANLVRALEGAIQMLCVDDCDWN